MKLRLASSSKICELDELIGKQKDFMHFSVSGD